MIKYSSETYSAAAEILELPRELEISTADLWLSTGAITITETGDENTYYINEFGHLFFCKNYPANQTKPN